MEDGPLFAASGVVCPSAADLREAFPHCHRHDRSEMKVSTCILCKIFDVRRAVLRLAGSRYSRSTASRISGELWQFRELAITVFPRGLPDHLGCARRARAQPTRRPYFKRVDAASIVHYSFASS